MPVMRVSHSSSISGGFTTKETFRLLRQTHGQSGVPAAPGVECHLRQRGACASMTSLMAVPPGTAKASRRHDRQMHQSPRASGPPPPVLKNQIAAIRHLSRNLVELGKVLRIVRNVLTELALIALKTPTFVEVEPG